jgi:CPA1 family monovalent cation:H+ antiporter
VPRRLLTIIEGESLVNDATALVAYKFALTAILTGAFSLQSAALQFGLVAAGGVIAGIVIGFAGIFLIKRLNNSTAETTLSLITSFAAYLAAEHLGFSGVISTVTTGFYFGQNIPRETSAQTRIEAEASWSTVLFIINGLVFTLIGLQLPAVIAGLEEYSWTQLVLYGSAITSVVIGVRFVWVFPASHIPRWLFPSIARKEPTPTFGAVFLLSWIGMRGIVSLAAALSIPLFLPSGAEFPFRNLLIFLTYTVILATLLIPAATLPWLIRWLGLKGGDENRRDEAVARLALQKAALRKIDSLAQASAFHTEFLKTATERYNRGIRTLESNLEPAAFSPLFDEEQRRRQLTRTLLEAEREELANLRQNATIHDSVFFQLSRELDIEETRLNSQRV